MTHHLTDDQLFEHADALAGSDAAFAAAHLEGCAECRGRLASFRSVEGALRRVPLERPSPALARAVLARIAGAEAPSWVYTLLKNVAPLVALMLVLVAVYAVLGSSGAPAQGTATGESARTMFRLADEYGATGIRSFNAWCAAHLAFAKGSGGLTTFLVLFFAGVALVDKYILMPRFRRRA
jgi:hypothetical protein